MIDIHVYLNVFLNPSLLPSKVLGLFRLSSFEPFIGIGWAMVTVLTDVDWLRLTMEAKRFSIGEYGFLGQGSVQ
jgi:hypothetical protein